MKAIGWLSTLFLTLGGLPEVYNGFLTGEVGVGYPFLIIWGLGEVFGTIYAIWLKEFPLIANFIINTGVVSLLLLLKSGTI